MGKINRINKINKSQGFTLIELMIVIAIIGILMAYAIPAYRDYTIRAKAGEGIIIAAAAKQAVSETYMRIGIMPTNNPEADIAAANTITGENIASVTVGVDGLITVLFNAENTILSGNNIFLAPTDVGGSILWGCTSDLADRYMPTACK